MSDEEDEKVEVQVVVAGHGGLRVDSLTGQRKGGRKTNAEWNAKEPPPKGQLSLTAFAARTQNKKPKMMATEGAMEVEGVEMTTFSSTITTNTSTSGRTPASAIATLPVTSSSGSTSKRQRGIGGDGVGGYHHEVLLPPSKDAAKEASGVEALSGAVEHIAAAVASKVETSVGEVVDRATVQLKENVGRVFDKAQQEAEARLAKLKAEAAELEKRRGARSQDALLLDPDIMQLSSGRVIVKGNQADAQGEVADFFIQRAPRKLRGKENEKREGKEKERERGGVRASWKLSGVLKKEQKLFSSTLRFPDFQNFPGLACSSSLGRDAWFAGAIRFSIPVCRPVL